MLTARRPPATDWETLHNQKQVTYREFKLYYSASGMFCCFIFTLNKTFSITTIVLPRATRMRTCAAAAPPLCSSPSEYFVANFRKAFYCPTAHSPRLPSFRPLSPLFSAAQTGAHPFTIQTLMAGLLRARPWRRKSEVGNE